MLSFLCCYQALNERFHKYYSIVKDFVNAHSPYQLLTPK